MKDLAIKIDDYKFNFRVCALIENKGDIYFQKTKTTTFLICPVAEFMSVKIRMMQL